jgi:hypothetical protein
MASEHSDVHQGLEILLRFPFTIGILASDAIRKTSLKYTRASSKLGISSGEISIFVRGIYFSQSALRIFHLSGPGGRIPPRTAVSKIG